jgi:hypothetical protein
MDQPTIRFPVRCPECGTEELQEYAVAAVAGALLTRETPLMLSVRCHGASWAATPEELDQIREYLGAVLSSLPVLSSRDDVMR